ncbi:MFS transporter [Prauserella shujinwangii]
MVALVYAIVELPRAGWLSWHTAGPLVAAVVLGVLFRRLERRSAAPLVPARVVRSRTVRGGNVVILCAGMAVDGMLITLTGYVQGMLGWSPLGFGLATAVMTVTSVAGTLTGQRLATAYGARPVAAAGAALAGLACAMLAWLPGRGSLPLLLCGLFLLGAGLGLAFVCAQIAAVTGVREEDSGFAAGLVDTSFALGTALGIAVCTSVATAAAPGGEPGYRAGFAAAAVFGLLGIAAALVVPRDRRAAPATERASAG